MPADAILLVVIAIFTRVRRGEFATLVEKDIGLISTIIIRAERRRRRLVI